MSLPGLLYTRADLSARITTVLLDFGGVLGLPQDPARVDAMAALCGLPREEFLAAYRPDRLELDRGTLAADEYWARILALGGRRAAPGVIEALEREDALGWTRVNHPMVAWSAELRAAGYRTAILSNMPPGKLALMRQPDGLAWSDGLEWIGDFEVALFSCDFGMVKPEPAFYRLCLERLGVSPEECVFVDDSAVNAQGARALGIHAIIYRSPRDTAAEIGRVWGLPVTSLLDGEGADASSRGS